MTRTRLGHVPAVPHTVIWHYNRRNVERNMVWWQFLLLEDND
jgi:hypothetical protein